MTARTGYSLRSTRLCPFDTEGLGLVFLEGNLWFYQSVPLLLGFLIYSLSKQFETVKPVIQLLVMFARVRYSVLSFRATIDIFDSQLASTTHPNPELQPFDSFPAVAVVASTCNNPERNSARCEESETKLSPLDSVHQ